MLALGPTSWLAPALVALGALPVVSPEIGPAPATGLPCDNSAHYAMAASNGAGFMVVWQDFRGSDKPWGTRLDGAARVLDPTGIPVGTPTYGRNPTVGSDGQDYLVVWEDYRSGSRGHVYGQRITASGVVLDPGGFQISPVIDIDQVPSVAFGGGRYLVAWADYSSGTLRIWAARVTATGAVEDPLGIPISAGPNEYGPSVTFDGQNFLVAWYVSNQVRAARVTPAGVVLDVPHIDVTAGLGGRYPAAGFDGQSFLLLFNRGTDIYGARVATDGGVVDPAGFPVSAGTWSEYYPSVACASSSCAGVWIDGRDAGARYGVFGARIDRSGTVLDDAGVWFMEADSYRPAIAFNGTEYLVASDQYRGLQDPNIYGTLASPAAFAPAVWNGALFSTAAAAQYEPKVASDGVDYLMVWQDERNTATTGSDIYAARVGRDGGMIDPAGFPVCTAPGTQAEPSAAFTGGGYVVTWLDYRDGGFLPAVWAARIDLAGRVVDANGFPVTAPGQIGLPLVTALDGGTLVVWQDGRNQADSGTDVYFARIDPAGTVLDPGGAPLVIAPGFQGGIAMDGDGDSAVVAWGDQRSGAGSDIYAAQVDALGVVSPPGGQAIAAGPHDEREPAVAVGRTEALIVWQDNRDAGVSGVDVYATRVSRANGIMDPGGFPVSAAPASQRDPAVAFDGADYLVTWEDWRNNRGVFGQITDIWAVRVSAGGAVLDDGGFTISEDPWDEYSSSAASDRLGHVLVAYNRAPVDTVDRALARLVTGVAAAGAPCGGASRCASGYCVDGVCCDSACGGGDPTDCQACGTKAGASADGQCVTLSASTVCRPSAGLCDVADRCDGASPSCPQDALRSGGEVCRPVAGACDVEESCTGQGAACPADLVVPSTTTCRPSAGPCDVPESCSGQSAACPEDGLAARGTECGGDGEVCSGTSSQCQVTLQAGCGCAGAPDAVTLAAALLVLAAAAGRKRRPAAMVVSCRKDARRKGSGVVS